MLVHPPRSKRSHRALARVIATGCMSVLSVGAIVLGEASAVRAESDGLFVKDLKRVDDNTYKSKRNMLTNRMARNADGSINVVIEIPAGTNQKWEVSPDGKQLVWELSAGQPRIVDYLPYLGNYGMVQRTLLDPEAGGDGQPVDVLVLGTTLPRGSEIRATPIGVVRVIDRFQQDDKIIAIHDGSSFTGVTSIESLNDRYPGVSEILRIWFANVHGTSEVQLMGTGSRAQANAVIDYAAEAYTKKSIGEPPTGDEKSSKKDTKKKK